MAAPAVKVEDLVKRYPTAIAVDGISFSVARGVTAALLGGNGAGKTTTLSILLGLGAVPQAWDPFVDLIDETALQTHFARLHTAIAQTVAGMPDHGDYIKRHVRAEAIVQ